MKISKLFILLLLLSSLQSKAQYNFRSAAYDFNKKLGRGINYMGSKINQNYHNPYDFELIKKNNFTHARIGGEVWQYVGLAPNYIIDSNKLASYKNAVDWALNQDLMVIINPICAWNNYNDTDSLKLYKLWNQLATAFANYPTKSVAFEIIDKSQNANLDLKAMTKACLKRIRAVPGNEKRIVVVSGQGFSTRSALIDAFSNGIFPSNDPYLIGTFHYYDPVTFVNQGINGTSPIYWADSGDNDSAWNKVIAKFQAVITADSNWAVAQNTEPLPIYNGEYGVDNAAPAASRLRWLWWIRTISEKMGFSHALWNLYNNSANSKGLGPWTSIEKNNPTSRTLDQNVLVPWRNRYEFENYTSTNSFYKVFKSSASNDSVAIVYKPYQDYIWISNIYIAKSGQYDVTIRYTMDSYSASQTFAYLLSSSNGQVIDSIYFELAYPGYSSWGICWGTTTLPLQFSSGLNNTFTFHIHQTNNQVIMLDYVAITRGPYYDNFYPPTPLTINESSFKEPNSIKVFPNPSNELIYIQGVFYSWELFNISGKKIASGNSKSIDVNKYSSGVYVLIVDHQVIKIMIR